MKKFAPQAKVLLFQDDAQCVAAVQQGRADAYVLDQGILIGDASTQPRRSRWSASPFTQEPYGIGLPNRPGDAKKFVDDWLQKIYDDGVVGHAVEGDHRHRRQRRRPAAADASAPSPGPDPTAPG